MAYYLDYQEWFHDSQEGGQYLLDQGISNDFIEACGLRDLVCFVIYEDTPLSIRIGAATEHVARSTSQSAEDVMGWMAKELLLYCMYYEIERAYLIVRSQNIGIWANDNMRCLVLHEATTRICIGLDDFPFDAYDKVTYEKFRDYRDIIIEMAWSHRFFMDEDDIMEAAFILKAMMEPP